MPTSDDYRSFELEAAAASSVARGRTALGSFLKFGVPVGALIVAAWIIYGTVARRSPTLRGRVWVPQPPGMMPSVTSVSAKRALRTA